MGPGSVTTNYGPQPSSKPPEPVPPVLQGTTPRGAVVIQTGSVGYAGIQDAPPKTHSLTYHLTGGHHTQRKAQASRCPWVLIS